MNASSKKLGFSLIELLLAIFILGIGIISIAALLPAGLAQQQKSTDELIGTIVARNALTIIRSHVEQEDFGDPRDFVGEDWSSNVCGISLGIDQNINPRETICGDWMWRRPGLINDDSNIVDLQGTIDIFAVPDNQTNTEWWPPGSDYVYEPPGIPYNKGRYADSKDPFTGETTRLNPPTIRILAGERQYPMWAGLDPLERPKADYYWDCMFRKYQGRILVAIFVYRVISPNEGGPYTVDTASGGLPFSADLTLQTTGSWPDDDDESGVVLEGSQFDDPTVADFQWQHPGQWIVDQNCIVHRVLRGRRRSNDDAVRLATKPTGVPVFSSVNNQRVPGVNANWWDKDNFSIDEVQYSGFGIVTDIWFVPTSDSKGRTIIPVYATVEDL
ncbi:MAG: prepilin-type N-terminal cleavage/methylation domain-containing protein [Phycisphaerales bacterium]|nr:prepilin-type N-terminal cleavage/methylation domain-containing protein [Phycisphaerales bacterium]